MARLKMVTVDKTALADMTVVQYQTFLTASMTSVKTQPTVKVKVTTFR